MYEFMASAKPDQNILERNIGATQIVHHSTSCLQYCRSRIGWCSSVLTVSRILAFSTRQWVAIPTAYIADALRVFLSPRILVLLPCRASVQSQHNQCFCEGCQFGLRMRDRIAPLPNCTISVSSFIYSSSVATLVCICTMTHPLVSSCQCWPQRAVYGWAHYIYRIARTCCIASCLFLHCCWHLCLFLIQNYPQNETEKVILQKLNNVFTSLFAIECALKVAAVGIRVRVQVASLSLEPVTYYVWLPL